MKYSLKKWQDKEYLVYETEQHQVFDNLHYVYIDLLTETVEKDLVCDKYLFDVTIRYIKKNKLENCQYIYFIPIPQKLNNFVFVIAYVSSDKMVLAKEYNNNVSDYLYYLKKLNNFDLKYGIIWELDGLDDIKLEFSDTVSTSYGVQVDGRDITDDDVLESSDFSIFSKDFLRQFKGYDLISYDLSINSDDIMGICFQLNFNTPQGKVMENAIYKNFDDEDKPYTVTIPFRTIKKIKDLKVVGAQ